MWLLSNESAESFIMNCRLEQRIACSFDLDDTVVGREGITRGAGALAGIFKRHSLPSYTISNLPEIDRTVVDEPLTRLEATSFIVHRRRNVFPGVFELLEEQVSDGADIFGNTGRSNKRAWVDMTWNSLTRGGISHFFRDIFFTPKGMETAVSKAVGLKELQVAYRKVIHVDDDPRTIAFLANIFPEMDIYLITYGTTGLLYSREEMSGSPHVHRIGSLRELRKNS